MITYALDGMLASATENLTMLRQARPGSLDDATVARVISVYTTQRDDLWLYATQIQRWQAESLTTAQRAAVARLTGQLARLGDTLTTILTLAEHLKTTTIEAIMAKSDTKHRSSSGTPRCSQSNVRCSSTTHSTPPLPGSQRRRCDAK